jgi:hypothetical protein
MADTSDSRPWKIFGSDGSIENEFELAWKLLIGVLQDWLELHTYCGTVNKACSSEPKLGKFGENNS